MDMVVIAASSYVPLTISLRCFKGACFSSMAKPSQLPCKRVPGQPAEALQLQCCCCAEKFHLKNVLGFPQRGHLARGSRPLPLAQGKLLHPSGASGKQG